MEDSFTFRTCLRQRLERSVDLIFGAACRLPRSWTAFGGKWKRRKGHAALGSCAECCNCTSSFLRFLTYLTLTAIGCYWGCYAVLYWRWESFEAFVACPADTRQTMWRASSLHTVLSRSTHLPQSSCVTISLVCIWCPMLLYEVWSTW